MQGGFPYYLPQVKTLRSLSAVARAARLAPRPLVLVPTMGALHAGHVTLLQKARQLAGAHGSVAASIFVNPTQFGPKEDLSRYPRTPAADARHCREAGVDLLFTPQVGALYAPDHSVWVDEERLSRHLCGASRPGHFRGVCTVVSHLFHLFAPEIAVFGKKDAQQLAIIRRMVRDLHFQIRIVGVETVREADGLAMSSRNAYLSPEERRQAIVLRQALLEARACVREGERRPATLLRQIRRRIETAPLARIDYAEIVDAATLETPQPGRHWLVALAVFFGKTRLIDNLEIAP